VDHANRQGEMEHLPDTPHDMSAALHVDGLHELHFAAVASRSAQVLYRSRGRRLAMRDNRRGSGHHAGECQSRSHVWYRFCDFHVQRWYVVLYATYGVAEYDQ